MDTRYGFYGLTAYGILNIIKSLFNYLSMPIDPDLQMWISANTSYLIWVNELTFFTLIVMIIAIPSLFSRLSSEAENASIIAILLFCIAIVIHFMITIIHGRLIYPVYDLPITDYSYIISIYYGGLHMVALLFGPAVIIISWILRDNRMLAIPGIMTGIFIIVFEGYPWIFSSILVLIAQIFISLWFIMWGLTFRIKES